MPTVNAYLTFNGNCEEAFNFYRSVFAGEFLSISRFSEMPPQEGQEPVPADEGNNIMHVSLPISDETVLMGSDTGGEWASSYQAGNNFSLSLHADTNEEADRLFAALSEGGQATMPMETTFWGSYFGMLTDQFGIQWMISVNLEQK